ncbi:MAG: universal stress protein [Flammeovirgaceae bacterium]|nr:universal stress protein [Flammeovirgaceae bacterium]
MKKILVPFDFTLPSENALDFATQLAERQGSSEIVLFHVIEHPSESRLKIMGATNFDPLENIFMTKLIQQSKLKLKKVINNVMSKVTVNFKILIGNPYVSLAGEVANQDVNLVIMGTPGLDDLENLFLSSNAEKVVRSAQCPVITIKNKIHIEKIKSIVFASNFENVNPRFIERVSFVQNLMQAQLRIVKINTPANFTNTPYDIKQMSEFVESNIISNYTIDIHNFNNEEDGIVDFANFIEADMIMLGTHQRKGMSHFFNRSVAEDVANNSKCPVITVQLDE